MSRISTSTKAFGRTGPHARRALLIKVAEVAFHGDSANAGHPIEQRADAGRSRRRGGRHRRVSVGGNIQRAAAGEFNRAERAGDAAQFAAHAQAFIELYRAVNASNGVDRTHRGARRVFTVVAHLRRRLFFITHDQQARHTLQAILAVRLGTGGFAGCGSRYRRWNQQLQNGSPGHPRVKVTFDEIRPRRCRFRHLSTLHN